MAAGKGSKSEAADIRPQPRRPSGHRPLRSFDALNPRLPTAVGGADDVHAFLRYYVDIDDLLFVQGIDALCDNHAIGSDAAA